MQRSQGPHGLILLDDEQQRALRREQHTPGYSQGRPSFGFTPLNHPTNERQQPPVERQQRPVLSVDTTLTNTSRLSGTARQRGPSAGSYPSTGSPRTNFTGGTGKQHYSQDSGEVATIMSGGASANATPSEYSMLRGSNPFITIEERESQDAIEAFAGARPAVRVSVLFIIIGAVVGVVLGIVLSTLKVSDVVADWVALPGTLFLRAIKSLVVPYVFCSVAVAIGDIVFVGKVSAVGFQTFKVFLTESSTSSLAGLAVALLFRPLFRASSYTTGTADPMGFVCGNGLALALQTNGTLACTADPGALDTNSTFQIEDVNDVFTTSDSSVDTTIGLSDQLLSILTTIVPENIFESMYNIELLSVISFAMVMGAIAGRNFFNKTRRVNYLYTVLLQLRNTFFLAIEWVIWATPVAIVFIIGGAFASNQDALSKVSDVYMYPIAAFCGLVVQMFVVVPAVYFIFTRCNPYSHMQHMVRAYVFAFCSASSLATAPITLGCIQKARVSSQSLSNFVVSVGVVANLTGAGWYFPIGIVFMAESSGNGDELTVARIIALYFLTLIACWGTPPIPSGGIAMMSTIYQTVFSTSGVPSTWALYVAMDVIADRFVTVCNVNDDIMALKVIAENTDETIAADKLGRRE